MYLQTGWGQVAAAAFSDHLDWEMNPHAILYLRLKGLSERLLKRINVTTKCHKTLTIAPGDHFLFVRLSFRMILITGTAEVIEACLQEHVAIPR